MEIKEKRQIQLENKLGKQPQGKLANSKKGEQCSQFQIDG